MTEKLPLPSPTIVGIHGRAWAIGLDGYRLRMGVDPAKDATVAMWIVEAAWAHPVWHSYGLVLTHLRPLEGLEPAEIYRPEATHEFWLYALDPNRERAVMLTAGLAPLHPMNFGAQFVAADDTAARVRMEEVVDAIAGGRLNPDTDNRRQWVALFGDAMLRHHSVGERHG